MRSRKRRCAFYGMWRPITDLYDRYVHDECHVRRTSSRGTTFNSFEESLALGSSTLANAGVKVPDNSVRPDCSSQLWLCG